MLTYIDNGLLIPIAYDNCISHFFAYSFATMFLAICLAIYAADLSTFVASFPENAPPPCLEYPPYVSTIIFLPVRPVSPRGPPITNSPFGLIKILVSLSIICSGITFLITSDIISFLNIFKSIVSRCCVDTTIFSILFGILFTYSTVT